MSQTNVTDEDGKALFCIVSLKVLGTGSYPMIPESVGTSLETSCTLSTPSLAEQAEKLTPIIDDFSSTSQLKQIKALEGRLRNPNKETIRHVLEILFGEANRTNVPEMLLLAAHFCLAVTQQGALSQKGCGEETGIVLMKQGADSVGTGLSSAAQEAGGWAKVLQSAILNDVDLFTIDAILGSASLRIGQEVLYD